MQIIKLLKELWPDKNHAELMKEREKLRNEKLLLIKNKGEPVGLLSYKTFLGTFFISRFVVTKTHRGLGLGTKLLTRAIAQAKKAGCWLLWLNTGIKRKKTIGFYTNFGLTKIMLFTIIFYKIIKH